MWSWFPTSLPFTPLSPHKKPLTRRTKFHWPSFVDLSGTAAVRLVKKKNIFKHRLLGLFCSGEAPDCCRPSPQRHIGRASAISSTTRAGAKTQGSMTSLYQMDQVWGFDSTPGRWLNCTTSPPSACGGELKREKLAVTGRRGGSHISCDTDTKGSWFFGLHGCLSHWSFTGCGNSCWPSVASKSNHNGNSL